MAGAFFFACIVTSGAQNVLSATLQLRARNPHIYPHQTVIGAREREGSNEGEERIVARRPEDGCYPFFRLRPLSLKAGSVVTAPKTGKKALANFLPVRSRLIAA